MFKQINKKIRLLKNKGKEPYFSIYKIVGFYPDDIQLYKQAFNHKSVGLASGVNKNFNNERLEFLGDAILDAIIADVVYKKFPKKREGFLTNTRSKIVQRETLDRIAIELGLDKMVRFSLRMNTPHNNHLYGNALEALIGAIYLDQGYRRCFHFVNNVVIKKHLDIEALARKEVNFKSSLIEWSQKNKLEIVFELIESFMDNDSNRVFQTAVCLGERQIGIGIGYSKKESQQNAAKMAVKKLRKDKELQQYISELQQSQSKEETTEQEFNELPTEGMEEES